MSTPERMLYEETPEPAEDSVDVTQAPDVEDFDFDAWLQGVRPTRRAVKIYARADLVARMEEVADGYDDSLPAQAKRKIRDEILALREQFDASARWFVVEGRSSDWVDEFKSRTAKRLGLDLGPDDAKHDELTPEQQEARKTVTLEQVAEQVASPSGVTADGLRKLGGINEGELNKIVTAVAFANGQIASSAGVLTRDFSPAHSGKSGTAGSKRR